MFFFMRHINIIVDKIKRIKSAYPDYYSNSKSEKVTGIIIPFITIPQ